MLKVVFPNKDVYIPYNTSFILLLLTLSWNHNAEDSYQTDNMGIKISKEWKVSYLYQMK